MASDLLSTNTASGVPQNVIMRGKLGIVPNFSGSLTPEKARLALYAEVYRVGMGEDSARVQVVVSNPGGFRYQTPSQARIYPAGIGSEAFALDLTGLPSGEYRLQMRLEGTATDTITLAGRIAMLAPGAGVVHAAPVRLYADLTEAELDSTWGPIRYVATADEIKQFENFAGADAKRHWLSVFWQARAAAAGQSVEEVLREWTARLAFVNRDFRPSARRAQPNRRGWQTDRGRIWLKHGPPTERETANQTRSQEIKACEMWRYTTGRGDRYVFFDRSGFGDYELVFSTDRNEPAVPGFEDLFEGRRFSCTTV
jgi:GWxTD domain-containing protein